MENNEAIMKVQNKFIGFRANEDLKKAIEKAAEQDDRNSSQFVRKIIKDTLKDRGLIK